MKLRITILKSVGIKADTHEGFCSWNMLHGHAPGAKLLRVYQRVHGYTSSSWIITEMNHPTCFTPCSWPLKGGTPGNLWWGSAAQFSKSWPYFRTKKCHFPYPFADQISKIQTHFSRMALFSLFQALRLWGGLPRFPTVLFPCSRFLN